MRANHQPNPFWSPRVVVDWGHEERPTLLRRLGRLDRAAFDRVASAHLPGLENVLPRLSRAADNGVLWFSTALVLSATRRARLRRAALRGSIAIAVASPAVNLLGKQAFRRKRPVVDLVPPVRIRWKLPTSHAFPSGHSASAAAFATGVAMEAPALVAAPVAATAAAVAFSRIYTGAHYPGDVLAGVGIGILAALGTRTVWPARPPVAHVGRTATERAVPMASPPLGVGRPPHATSSLVAPLLSPDAARPPKTAPDGLGLVVVVNSQAGRGGVASRVLRREFPEAEFVLPEEGDELDKVLDRAAERAEVLAVVGGDGTINAGARAALDHGVPLLAVPAGTFDHFARALGIEAAEDAVTAYRGGELGRVDVGFVVPGGEPGAEDAESIFLNTAAFGAYTEMVDRRNRLEGRLGKWPALVVAAARTLRHSEPVEMIVDGRPRRVWLAFIGNCMFGSRGPAPTWREHLDDGQLDIRMVTAARRVPRVRALAAVLLGHLHITPGYKAWHGGTMELVALDGPLRIARDGEVETVAQLVRFGKRAGSLSVFCPPGLGAS
ncbi:bifunctional phosphatase PAP2/diacylglycerol kinase family protein [Spirillospora sp. CA-294931]|uniref:bifunctional phosphatase PAP2/diacylglycerol kinase family protein n=1 Tax=Spirillospora sp. CA-294931 TaxID=3240042 RepID=UPI003D8DD36A